MQITSDDKQIKNTLEHLKNTLVKNGAWFAPHLAAVCENKNISLHIQKPNTANEQIIKLPIELLIPAQPLHLAVENNQFTITPDQEKLSPIQIEIASIMIDLFNMTDKVNFYRHESPWITFRSAPELMKDIVKARTVKGNLDKKVKFLDEAKTIADEDRFIADHFFHSRVIGDKHEKDSELVQKIMPVIDYLNHDHRANSYIVNDQNDDGDPRLCMKIINSQPFIDRSECFVSYGTLDSLDSFFNYGFIHDEAPLVRSVPMTITIKDCPDLHVQSFPAHRIGKKVHKQYENIQRLLPRIFPPDDEGNIAVSHLIIGLGNMPHLLRRTLHLIISQLAGEQASPSFIIDRVYETEKTIIANNISFYKELQQKIDSYKNIPEPQREQAQHLASIQLSKLYKYHYDYDFFKAESMLSS